MQTELSLPASGTVCNTVPTSPTTPLPPLSYSCRVDWVTIRIIADEPGESQSLVDLVGQTMRDSFEVLPGPHPVSAHNCTYDWMAISVKGIRAYWFNPGNGLKTWNRVASIRFEFPGAVCAAVNSCDLRDLLALLATNNQAVCTRLDAALDDYTKQLWSWEDLATAARSGHYSGPKSYSIIESANRGETAGLTHYFGTRKSEAFYRFYDKSVESGGAVDSNRMEVEFKRSKAHQAFEAWLLPAIGDEHAATQVLLEFLMGNIDFIDRDKGDKNLGRCPRLGWWQSMKDALAEGVKLAPIRPVQTIERSLQWLEKRVFPTIVALERVLGDEAQSLWNSFRQWGMEHQSRRHNALITAAQLEGWGA